MTESPIVNEWIAKAQEESELKGVRDTMIQILNLRFPGQVPSDIIETIRQQPSLAVLRDWFERAVLLPLDEFGAYLLR